MRIGCKMSFTDFIKKYPYFLYTLGGAIVLGAEAISEVMSYQYIGPSFPFTSVLPRNTMIVAAVYDIAVIAFPLLMTINRRNAIKWGYFTAIFGTIGQYLNINIGALSGVVFIVILLTGLAPAITARRKDKTEMANVV